MVGMLFRQARLTEVPPLDRSRRDRLGGGRSSSPASPAPARCAVASTSTSAAGTKPRRSCESSPPSTNRRSSPWLPLALLGRLLARRGDPDGGPRSGPGRGGGHRLRRSPAAADRPGRPRRARLVGRQRRRGSSVGGHHARRGRVGIPPAAARRAASLPAARGRHRRAIRRLPPALGTRTRRRLTAAPPTSGSALGFPFERALELADVGEPDATAQGHRHPRPARRPPRRTAGSRPGATTVRRDPVRSVALNDTTPGVRHGRRAASLTAAA